MNLLATLLDYGVDAAGYRDWVGNVRPGAFSPVGVCVHHTASGDGEGIVDLCYRGRAGLAGPLCNLVVRKSGRVHVTSNGKANDTGMGSRVVLDDVRRDKTPPGTAKQRGLPDDENGNPWFYDIEIVNLGDGNDPYPVHQIASVVSAVAAICEAHGWGASRVIGHAEWSARKVDPRGLDMNHLRDAVASRLSQGDDMTPDQDRMLREINAKLIHNTGDVVNLTASAVSGPGHHNLGDLFNLLAAHIDKRIEKAVADLKAEIKG